MTTLQTVIIVAIVAALVNAMIFERRRYEEPPKHVGDCIYVPGAKGVNGGGDGGSAVICGEHGVAVGGAGGNVR